MKTKEYSPCLVQHPLGDIEEGIQIIEEEFKSDVGDYNEGDFFTLPKKIKQKRTCYAINNIYPTNTFLSKESVIKGIKK